MGAQDSAPRLMVGTCRAGLFSHVQVGRRLTGLVLTPKQIQDMLDGWRGMFGEPQPDGSAARPASTTEPAHTTEEA